MSGLLFKYFLFQTHLPGWICSFLWDLGGIRLSGYIMPPAYPNYFQKYFIFLCGAAAYFDEEKLPCHNSNSQGFLMGNLCLCTTPEPCFGAGLRLLGVSDIPAVTRVVNTGSSSPIPCWHSCCISIPQLRQWKEWKAAFACTRAQPCPGRAKWRGCNHQPRLLNSFFWWKFGSDFQSPIQCANTHNWCLSILLCSSLQSA